MHWRICCFLLPWIFTASPTQERAKPGTGAPEARLGRVYDIGFLTRPIPDYPARAWPRAGALGLVEGIAEMVDGGSVEFDLGRDDDRVTFSVEALKQLIRQNIAEDSWANQRNVLEYNNHLLLVKQSLDVHRAIERVLARMREERARMAAVDVAVVPIEALGGGVESSSPWIEAAEFDRIVDRAAGRGSLVSLAAYNEQTMSGLSGKWRATASDTEINQTGVLPVANMVVQSIPIGVSLEMLPQAIAGTDLFRLRFQASRLALDGEAVKRRTLFSDLEFVKLREESLDTVLLLDEKRAGIAGFFDDRCEDGVRTRFAVIARLRPVAVTGGREAKVDDGTGDTDDAGAFRLELHDLSFLLQAFQRQPAPYEPKVLSGLLELAVEPDAWRDRRAKVSVSTGRFLTVTAKQGTRDAVRRFLSDRVREHARMARVSVREFLGTSDDLRSLVALSQDGVYLPPGWRATEPGARAAESLSATTLGVLGSRSIARGVRTRSFVADVECVSGGTGFSIIEMPDPVVVSSGNGFELLVETGALLEPERALVRVELVRAVTEFERQALFRSQIEVQTNSGEGSANLKAPRRRMPFPFIIDLPEQRSIALDKELALDLGREAILRLEVGRGGVARMVVVRVDVSDAIEKGAK